MRIKAEELTLGGQLARAVAARSDGEALVYDGRRATWAELQEQVIERARSLIGLGVRQGDHVGLLMPNCYDYVVLYYAINLIGGVAVLLNARYRADDLAYVIPKAKIRVLIIGGQQWQHCDYRPLLERVLPGLAEWQGGQLHLPEAPALEMLFELGDSRPGQWPSDDAFSAAATGVDQAEVLARAAAVSPDQVGLMIFSSGTTAHPKACMLNHRSLTLTGMALAERFQLTEQDIIWDPLPLFHMSTILPLAACRASGACFIGMGHFDADSAMSLLIKERPTVHYAGFPAIIGGLISHKDFAAYDQSRLRINHVVGPPDLLRRYANHFPGAVPVNSYGLTEASGVPCYSRLDEERELLFTTNGNLFDGMEAKIIDEDGRELPEGQPGEICLRGFAIFPGYYDDAEATAKAVDGEGWLHTGDLGSRTTGGRLIYSGRVKDMLKIGGENVAAIELESFLMTHPAIRMAQVIGVPDERLMEVAAAYIELEPGHRLRGQEVVAYCLDRIASYKIPRYVRFVEAWPMSATKVQKFQLRQGFIPTGRIEPKLLSRREPNTVA